MAGATSKLEVSFWLKLSLALHEAKKPEDLDRVMIFLSLFYLQSGDAETGLTTFRETIYKMKDRLDYTNVLGLNMCGRFLSS